VRHFDRKHFVLKGMTSFCGVLPIKRTKDNRSQFLKIDNTESQKNIKRILGSGIIFTVTVPKVNIKVN